MRCKDNGKNGIRLQFFGKKDFFCYFCPELIQRFMAIIILLLYAALVFLTIKFKQTITPAGVMVFLWTALNATLLIFFRDMVELKYSGLFYILAGVSLFLIGALIAHQTSKLDKTTPLLTFKRTAISPLLLILIALALVNPIYNIYSYGFSLSNFLNVEDLSAMTKEFSLGRQYSAEQKHYSTIAQLFLICTYTAPLFGGFCWLISKRGLQKSLCIITVLPCILITASQSTKMTSITALILWLSGFFIAIVTYNIKVKITIKTIIAIISIPIILGIALFYSMLTRYSSDFDNNKVERNKITFFNYTFGSLLCFDYWFDDFRRNNDYSTTILQNSKLHRLGYLTNTENGVRVDFPEYIKAPSMEIYGNHLDECEFFAGNNYTVSFDVTSNIQPDSVKYSLFSYTTMPKGQYQIMMDSCKQTGLHTWHYQLSFSLDSNRLFVRTPDIILSYDSVKYVEITKLRIDTGAVAKPWIINSNNLFWHNNQMRYGVLTFFGVANALGIAKRNTGIYRDFTYFGRLDKTMRSNVYTIFRMLIDDFGIVGALVFLLLLGFASAKAIVFIKKRKMIFLSQAFLVAVYSYVMWGFVASIWAYTSIICAYGLTFLIFSILQKPLHGDTWVTKIAKILKPKQK